ncbi:DMT family transporter [Oceanospirillum linum]|uniref:EamA family transporter n=1 Tax=Oceanospirillum linum TaxID=966 RepID=A0A1T1HDP0_OCELI|nr:DMT family transporter [Oceanospirillum linum]OOV87978.1 EamA family transporter [Oceanospirillum linum]SEG50761.1 Threonine/homoserine efflux transporter RhtA [Oleiphilus messinensis]SMP35365.1 Threonine/homoserine efflux transporter RhtA [Oceanospirillum linum]
MSSDLSSGRFLIAAALSAFFMGTIGTISHYAGVSAEAVTFYRLFFGALLMALFLLATRQKEKLIVWPGVKVLLTGAFLAGFVVFYVLSMQYTSMANAIMLIYLAPVAASVVAHFFMGERLTGASVGLILLALFGFAMMMEFNLSLKGRADEALGLFYGLCAMACYAAFILTNRLIEARVHVLTRSGYQMFAGALCMLPLMLLQGDVISLPQWGWLVLAGIVPGFMAIVLAVVALRALPASTFGTLAYLEPITVVALGWLLFGQSLNLLQLSGCGLIMFSGVAQALLSSRPSPESETCLAP